jgi:hypothetical protein
MKNLLLILSLIISTSVLAQNQEFCVSITLEKDCVKSTTFQGVKYLLADNIQMKEEHQKANYFMVSDYITLGNCGEETCCFDSFKVLKNETVKTDIIFYTELYVIVFDEKANMIIVYLKNEKLYYQYKVLSKCDF